MRNSGVIWGAFLILAGALFLLNSFGILPGRLWTYFWPAALIVFGLVIVINTFRPSEEISESLALQLKGFDEAAVDIHYGAGRLQVRDGAAPDELLSGRFNGGVSHRLSENGAQARVSLRPRERAFWEWSSWRDRTWDVALNGDIPLALELETGAAETFVDLARTRTTRLTLRTGASSTEITLPAAAGHTGVDIEGGAGAVSVRLPEGVAGRIEGTAALGALNVDERRFPRAGSVWQSPDYDTAANRAEIQVQFGAGEVRVR